MKINSLLAGAILSGLVAGSIAQAHDKESHKHGKGHKAEKAGDKAASKELKKKNSCNDCPEHGGKAEGEAEESHD